MKYACKTCHCSWCNGCLLSCPLIIAPHRYEILESTWQEEPQKRPSFSDIVQMLSDGVKDTSATSDDVAVEQTTSEPSDYIIVQQS